MADSAFQDLPDDPEQAFLVLEDQFRRTCERSIDETADAEDIALYRAEYVGRVVAAIVELKLQPEFGELPKFESATSANYQKFSRDVMFLRTKLELRLGRRVRGYSVRLDAATKEKIRHHLTTLRVIFDKLEVEEERKEALFEKLNQLQQEVDRDRTRFDAFAALAIEAGGVVGDVVEKSNILKVLDSVARVFWGAKKEEEETKRLPSPATPKRIGPPQPKSESKPPLS